MHIIAINRDIRFRSPDLTFEMANHGIMLFTGSGTQYTCYTGIAINRDTMTRISKQVLAKQVEERLFAQFIDLVTTTDEHEEAKLFSALLTKAERIMLIKRLAIVVLLTEGYSTYAIAETLFVSDSTVRLARAEYDNGRFDPIVERIKKKSFDKKAFWETIEVLLRAGLPPRGKGRWEWLDDTMKR